MSPRLATGPANSCGLGGGLESSTSLFLNLGRGSPQPSQARGPPSGTFSCQGLVSPNLPGFQSLVAIKTFLRGCGQGPPKPLPGAPGGLGFWDFTASGAIRRNKRLEPNPNPNLAPVWSGQTQPGLDRCKKPRRRQKRDQSSRF